MAGQLDSFDSCIRIAFGAAGRSGVAAVAGRFRRANERGLVMTVPTFVVKPGEGRSVCLGGMGVVLKVSGADTGGAFAVVEHPIEPGRLVLPRVHAREEEYSYVLGGRAGARGGPC